MSRFIIISFAVLGWAFWEMSGGAQFVPEQRAGAEHEPEPIEQARQSSETSQTDPTDPLVSRANGLQLTRAGVEAPELLIQQASLADTDRLLAERAAEARAAAQAARAARATASEPAPDLRQVAGSWVNLRTGPGTSHGKITALPIGTEVEVLDIDSSGWARLRVVESDLTGWMAERLLTDADT